MAEFKLDRFKYRWRGDWSAGTEYRRDDVVRLNGNSWVCLVAHTASSDFGSALSAIVPNSTPPIPDPYWTLMTSSKTFVGAWAVGDDYYPGDVVLKDGSLYECVTNHVASAFSTDRNNWIVFSDHIQYLGNWQSSTDYGVGAVVKYGSNNYRCVNDHQSGSDLEDNAGDWQIFNLGDEYRSNWSNNTNYILGDLVKYGGSILKALDTHNSGGGTLDRTKWQTIIPGYQYEGEWNSESEYQEGDVVTYSGNLWQALIDNVDVNPAVSAEDSSAGTWIQLIGSYNFQGQFDPINGYLPGDIVQAGGNLYQSKKTVGGAEDDGSTAEFIDPARWELLKEGFRWKDKWQENEAYYLNDVVHYFGTAYICNTPHTSADNNFPGDNGSGFEYWDILSEAGSDVGMSERGDLLSYGLKRNNVGDTSTLGTTGVPIGEPDQVLSVNNEEAFWRNYLNDADVVYVSQNGVDDEGYGTSIYKPFKTVRHALEYVEDNYDPLSPVTVRVATGRYSEIAPMSVPAGCVVYGDELRSTTIEANQPLAEYQNDYDSAHLGWIGHLGAYIDNIFNNLDFTPTTGNNLEPVLTLAPTGSQAPLDFSNLIQDYRDYIEFRIGNGNVDPTQTGTNTKTTDQGRLLAARKLRLNRNFIIEESIARLNQTQPNIDHSRTKIRSDVISLLRAIEYDLEYPGNYKTLLAARRYANAVLGSQLDDLFYFRDTTGIRNCTLEGLQGILNPPGTFELFRRPTGKSYCSLDPGWGPADERVWINNRSPYLQGVTNIGTACIGQKIDGSLHNGGNKSMVSNDFTQVLSDGIGSWILNNGRAELVSVFTYYCTIGYFAENGGIIRSANGNCSYGRFGAIADGNDSTEVPQTAQVFNRNNEALVRSIFAGEFTDQIFAFEYDHCGEEYSNAQAEITGAGADADVEYEEFRDGAVYQLRLVNSEGSGLAGGAGYRTYSGNAQSGNGISIQLSQTTELDEADIINMRIVLVSGDGTGQFGYIQSYNVVNKTAQVYRESDDSPGWDHIVPGTPIESTLSTNAQYRIEPRVNATAPGFSTNDYNLSNTTDIVDATHGNTSGNYTNITVGSGSGSTDQTVSSQDAVFSVARNGADYTVSLTSGGAGYAVGDELTIQGNQLGGTSPANDLSITVTATTEDSTNSITGFVSDGIGVGGRFVAISTPNFVQYSDNGESWTLTNLPSVANWRKVFNANGVFLAIAGNSNIAARSEDGANWQSQNLPATENWSDIAYGKGRFVIVAENSNTVAVSEDGAIWSTATIPNSTSGDSSASQWQSVAYGAGKFVAISGSNGEVAQSEDGSTWSINGDSTKLPSTESTNWIKLLYGNNRWLAVSRAGETVYSLDGNIWYNGTSLPSSDESSTMSWQDVEYFQGVFMAVGGEPGDFVQGQAETSFAVTTEDGLLWTERDLNNNQLWKTLAHATVNDVPTWVAIATLATNSAVTKIFTGARLRVRASVTGSNISSLKILDPGSGYTDSDPPEITIVDNSFTTAVGFQIRIGNGVLPQPSFVNRGVGYRTSSTRVAVTGDGYADIIPEGTTLTVSGVETVPGPGVQIRIEGILDEDTPQEDDLELFNGLVVTDLGDDNSGAGTRLVEFQISPSLEIEYNLEHSTNVTLRERYSQCRISGHDFLDIGTGNFEETNYPEIYASGSFFVAAPENEVREENGGRVFYASTDQDGNFRAGELFAVEQATGIVTISADFFELDGLSELALGGVRLGGSGTVVREFSTDPNFTQDSNNIVPTQRAIATFLANRLSEGGSEVETNQLIAGIVQVGGEENVLGTSTGSELQVSAPANIEGNEAEITGFILAQQMALRTTPFDDGMQ